MTSKRTTKTTKDNTIKFEMTLKKTANQGDVVGNVLHVILGVLVEVLID